MKKLLSVIFLFSLIVSFTSIAPNVNAIQIPEGAIIKTATNPDVYIVKYKNGKQFKRLVLNPQVFESYGHLRWEDILTVSQSEMNSFVISNLVRVDGQVDVYQLIANGDIGSKHFVVSNNFDLDSIYTINSVDFGNYTMNQIKEETVSNTIDPLIKIELCKSKAKFYADQKAKSGYLSAMIKAQESGDSETAMFLFNASIKPEHPYDYDYNYQLEYLSCLDS